MYLRINHLFWHERALTVAPKHKKLVELAQSKSLGLSSKIVCTTLIRGCGHLNDRLPYLCPTIFSGLATPLVQAGAHELPKAAKEHITTVPSKYELHSHAAHFFGSSHSHHGWMSSLYCVLNWLIIIIMHIHMHFIALQIPLIDTLF